MQGLCIGPDVSHTVDKSDCKTEGNGVGDFEEPPVITKGFSQVKDILECADKNTVLLSFNICLSSDVTFTWETMLVEKNLFVELPSGILPHSSKERYNVDCSCPIIWTSDFLFRLLVRRLFDVTAFHFYDG